MIKYIEYCFVFFLILSFFFVCFFVCFFVLFCFLIFFFFSVLPRQIYTMMPGNTCVLPGKTLEE